MFHNKQQNIFLLIIIITYANFAASVQDDPSNCTFRTDPLFDRIYAQHRYHVDYIPPDLICVRSTPAEIRNELRKNKDQINDLKCDSCSLSDLSVIDEIKELKDFRSISWVNQTIATEYFRKLINVEQFYLKENNLVYTDELFRYNTKLKILHIYLNYARVLPDNLFTNNINLQVIIINRCKIHQLPSRLFETLQQLHIVNLKQNHITKLPKTLFKHNKNLIILNLSYNRIMSINKEFVDNIENLQELYLTGNPIYELAIDALFKLNLNQFRIDYLPCVTLRDKLIPFCKFQRQCEWDECVWEEKQCLYYKPDPKGTKRISLVQVDTDSEDILKDQWIESHIDGIVCINYCSTDLKHVPATVDHTHLMNLMDALNQTLQKMLQKHLFVVPALAAYEDLNDIKKLL